MGRREQPLAVGEVPNPINPPSGCAFHPRCPLANETCRQLSPELVARGAGKMVACHAAPEDGSLARAPATPTGQQGLGEGAV
jgi:peptide/nickel transport system ATP-binding protein